VESIHRFEGLGEGRGAVGCVQVPDVEFGGFESFQARSEIRAQAGRRVAEVRVPSCWDGAVEGWVVFC
jgi:hypothetical protein